MIVHLITRAEWVTAQAAGGIIAESLSIEGFVHCSAPHQSLHTATRFFPARDDLLALLVDESLLGADLRWEPPAHPDGSPTRAGEEFFPHLYASLPITAVMDAISLQWTGTTYAAVAPLHPFRITALAEHPEHWEQAAQWSFEAWNHEFPNDTVQTYLDQYTLAANPGDRLVEVYCALGSNDRLLGLTTLVDDDELPGVIEPGPWIAAVWVHPDVRLHGVGGSLVLHATLRAHARGVGDLCLYTEDQQAWYERHGWKRVRDTMLNALPVTVMTKRLSPPGATA